MKRLSSLVTHFTEIATIYNKDLKAPLANPSKSIFKKLAYFRFWEEVYNLVGGGGKVFCIHPE